MDVSVVIAAYNEERHLPTLMQSIREQDRTLEVIVVDDGSSDGTAQVAANGGATVIRIDHVGPARARNVGVESATGEVVVFLDGDMACGPGFIDRLVAPIEKGRVVGTFSRDLLHGDVENRWAAAYAALRGHGVQRVIPADFPDRWENFRAIRRDTFLAAGGYDDVGYGSDMTLAPKVGELALAAPGAVCFHYNPDSLHEIVENARWIGRGAVIDEVPRPWLDNSPPVAFWRALRDIRRGWTWRVLPARMAYHAAILLGLLERRLAPRRIPFK